MPTSYFNGVSVTTGKLAHFARNGQINFNNGVVALVIWTIIFGIGAYIVQHLRQGQKSNREYTSHSKVTNPFTRFKFTK